VSGRADLFVELIDVATKTKMPSAPRGRDLYLELVREFPLRPLRSEPELDRAIAVIDSLSDREDLAPGERDYLLVLARLIEDYETEHAPPARASGGDVLRLLIEANDRTQARVAADTGVSESSLSEILSGKRPISRKAMKALAGYFHVDPAVFI
jgi:HTH-type transcriptional regulator/antitoxin HigA